MRIVGCDLRARQQTLAMLDAITGEVVNRTLLHEGSEVREFSQKALSCILQQCCAPVWVSAKEFLNPPLDLDRSVPTLRLSE